MENENDKGEQPLMMNMQDLFHNFLSLVIVRNVDLKPFLISKNTFKSLNFISIRQKIDNGSIFFKQK